MRQILILSIALYVLYTVPAVAQNDTTGWGRNSTYNGMYNPETTIKIKGEIIAVKHTVPLKGMSAGIHLLVNAGNETISVHLGPEWYIDRQEIRFQEGDKVEAEGSKVILDSQYVIIAGIVKKGEQILILRDRNGIPQWSGRRHNK